MSRVDGKIGVVTGGTQGLGAAVAWQLARSGAAGLVTCGRNAAKGNAVAQAIREETGCDVRFVQADLGVATDVRTVVAAADKSFGRVDMLVNAAGITDRGDILTTDEALFDRMFAINTRAPFFLMQDTIRIMVREGTPGTIVNIGSGQSLLPNAPERTAYAASKGGVLNLTRALAADLPLPVIAAGGLMDGHDARQALSWGAVAVQMGTAFIGCPESGADAVMALPAEAF